ncbi:uncharacterized protein LOC119448275 [Dermacentor silvarum]|uniref:uncharacterized protein LOC119448275 n=1 Tax=Dermacentor silvarum TaxID=543639 RepID=UPI0021017D09|nr:uncharacterized protein LOC119448275 [Dermacentor silvarum]
MASPAILLAALEYAAQMKRIRPDLPSTALLAAELMKVKSIIARSVVSLPVDCTLSSNQRCHLLNLAPGLNELLHVMTAEISECDFEKVAVRLSEGHPVGRDQLEKFGVAVIFLHCVLTKHRCVERLEFVLPREQRVHDPILCDALVSLTSVTSLSLRRCSFNANDTAKVFAAVDRLLLSQLVELSLEFLEIDAGDSAALDNFMEGLKKTTTLKFLRVLGVRFNTELEQWASIFREKTLYALSTNTSLVSVVVDAPTYAEVEDTNLKTMLKNPAIPAELTVISHKHNQHRKSYLVFDALAANKTVTKVHIKNFNLYSKDIEYLAKMLSVNNTIQELCLAKSAWAIPMPNVGMNQPLLRPHVRHLVEGLSKTMSLQRLAVRCHFSADEIRRILTAADLCESLQELHFPSLESINCRQIYDALQDTGVPSKLTIERLCLPADSELAKMVIVFSQALRDRSRSEPLNLVHARLGHSCEPLGARCGDHLRVLYFTCNARNVHPDIPRGIRAYLAVTKSLEKLHMEFIAAYDMTHIIIDGLRRNKSVKELHMLKFSMRVQSMGDLCRWLTGNQLVHCLEMNFYIVFESALLIGLAKCLKYNYTLTSVDVHEVDHSHWTALLIQNSVRRNNASLKRAAAHVIGSSRTSAAIAYRNMWWHPQLKAEVQRMASISEGEANQKILDAEEWRRALESTDTNSSKP